MDLSEEAHREFTTQKYSQAQTIEGVIRVGLPRFTDDGGSFSELARLYDDGPPSLGSGQGALAPFDFRIRQINHSEMESGVIKAFHLHRKQGDLWYVPPSDRCLVILCDYRRGSPTEGKVMRFPMGRGHSATVYIPPGVAHGVRNLGDRVAHLFYFVDQVFDPDPDRCDEGRLPWDMLGPEVWDESAG